MLEPGSLAGLSGVELKDIADEITALKKKLKDGVLILQGKGEDEGPWKLKELQDKLPFEVYEVFWTKEDCHNPAEKFVTKLEAEIAELKKEKEAALSSWVTVIVVAVVAVLTLTFGPWGTGYYAAYKDSVYKEVQTTQGQEEDLNFENAMKVLQSPAFPEFPDEPIFQRNTSSIEAINTTLMEYLKPGSDFDKLRRSYFLLMTGRKASGKTTLVQKWLWDRNCVIPVGVTLVPGMRLDMEQLVLRSLGVSLTPRESWKGLMKKLVAKCRDGKTPLVVYIDVAIDEKTKRLSYEETASIGHTIGSFGRLHTYDFKLCRLIIESSISQVSDVITRKHGDIAKKLHVTPLNLTEFKEACKLKFGTKHQSILNDTAIEEWYHKLGSNIRDLGDELEMVTSRRELMDEITRMYHRETRTIKNLSNETLTLLEEVAKAGPRGFLCKKEADGVICDDLLERGPEDTVLHLKGGRVALWRMSHVHYLLEGGKENMSATGGKANMSATGGKANMSATDDKEKMKNAGWV